MEKLFFNKGLISGLILLGQGGKQYFSEEMFIYFYTNIILDKKNCLPRILATVVNLPNIAGALNNLIFFGTIANLATNQDTTLYIHII